MINIAKRAAIRIMKKAGSDAEGEYGGRGPFHLPDDHVAGMIVVSGGFSCANCVYADIRDDGPHCTEENWVNWNGGESRLPVDDPSTYCSDFFKPNEE